MSAAKDWQMITPEAVGLSWGILWALMGVVVATNIGIFFAIKVEAVVAKRMAVSPPWSQSKDSVGELCLSAAPFVLGVLSAFLLRDVIGNKWVFIGGTIGALAHLFARVAKLVAAKWLQQRLGVVLSPDVGSVPIGPEQKKE